MAPQTSENFYATINPEAVDCPHNGNQCFHHSECAERCGRIMAETIYNLKGWGYGQGSGVPTPRTVQIAAPTEHIETTDQQLRNARAENGMPLFDVRVLSSKEDRRRMGLGQGS
ncbi:hypothetical protein HOF56_04000 [Candidatus Peribacteria bacterium]|jgi:hypothetical protein|nr:hypothetical protein [Candidatus Peribacteria bacterium]MBT4021433.1 hypothetical protein [Candidatus Peribacteria bacterium]MBT4240449.1 hypothetical protein [Candidatus Peribacteria bacterium]MBT4474531.1 hypothetical protein [Candidatus Peribacteria bacterium]